MIDNNDDIQQRNVDLLIVGYWYEDLPPIIDIANMKEKIRGLLKILIMICKMIFIKRME